MKSFIKVICLFTAVVQLLQLNCITRNNANPISISQPGGGDNGTTATLTVQNNSSYTIYYLNISPSSDTSWGDNLLGTSTVAPGASFTVQNIPAGTFDQRAQTSGGSMYAISNQQVFVAGHSYTWTLTNSNFSSSSSNATLTVQNNSSYTIYYLNISPSSDTSWGNNLLGASTVAPGASFTVRNIPAGTFDQRAQTSGRSMYAISNQQVFVAGHNYTWTLTNSNFSSSSSNVTLTVQNNSSYSIYYLNISSSSDTSWGNDLLGTSTIASGASFVVYNIVAGTYDLRAQTSARSKSAISNQQVFVAGHSYTWTLSNTNFTTTNLSKKLITADVKGNINLISPHAHPSKSSLYWKTF